MMGVVNLPNQSHQNPNLNSQKKIFIIRNLKNMAAVLRNSPDFSQRAPDGQFNILNSWLDYLMNERIDVLEYCFFKIEEQIKSGEIEFFPSLHQILKQWKIKQEKDLERLKEIDKARDISHKSEHEKMILEEIKKLKSMDDSQYFYDLDGTIYKRPYGTYKSTVVKKIQYNAGNNQHA